MGLTEFYKKNMPHITPMALLCMVFVAATASGPTIVMLERMQTKSKTSGLDYFDLAIFVVYEVGIVGGTILAFRNQKFGEWKAERETEVLRKKTAEQTQRLTQLG